MIRLSEVAEETANLSYSPVVFGIGTFLILGLALYAVTRLDADR